MLVIEEKYGEREVVAMAQMVGIRVPLTTANVSRCMCPKCPVQEKSPCVSGKISKIGEALMKIPLNGEDIPGVYCSSGKATCPDINTGRACICDTCTVHSSYQLASGRPNGHFCQAGAAR